MDVAEARRLAEAHLAGTLDRRWRHVQAVAVRAEEVAAALEMDRELLVGAAWLHDIGYAPEASDTGFHPLDGARLLRSLDIDERVVVLVAHHSCATIEANERGLENELRREFPIESGPVADALWFCDMTTGPDGERLSVDERLAEIRRRYGAEHVVTRFVNRAEVAIRGAADRTEQRLRAAEEAGDQVTCGQSAGPAR